MKVIKIINNIGKYKDNEEFKILNEDLKFKIEYEDKTTTTSFEVFVDNGKYKKRFSSNGEFEIEQDFLKIGILKINISIIENGFVISKICVEDLIIKENSGSIEAIPEVAELKKLLANYKAENELLEKKIDKATKLIAFLYKIKLDGGK